MSDRHITRSKTKPVTHASHWPFRRIAPGRPGHLYIPGLLCALLFLWGPVARAEQTDSCQVVRYFQGSPDRQTSTRYGLVLMGGGTDVDSAFHWMAQQAGGGDLVVLRSAGGEGYQDYLYRQIGGFNSVSTLLIDSREKAACPAVIAQLQQAEAVFLAGGDQAEYYRFWNKTPLEDTLHTLAQRKRIPIGGTSAGLAVLGEWVYSAELDTITSTEALQNPFHPRITLRRDFLSLPLMNRIITDSHFAQRGRQGRLVSFLARAAQQGAELLGIGVDEATALLVSDQNQGQVVGSGSVWLFQPRHGGAEICRPGHPLHWWQRGGALAVQKLSAGAQIDLTHPQSLQKSPLSHTGAVNRGHLTISP